MKFNLVGHVVTSHGKSLSEIREGDIIDALTTLQREYKSARVTLDNYWDEAWALYIGSPVAMEHNRSNILRTVGDESQQYWHSRVNTGKAYESVETIVGYIMSALFPNEDYFTPIPTAPGYMELVPVIKQLMTIKLGDGNFKEVSRSAIRQCIITGTSTVALPWRYETLPIKRKVQVKKPRPGGNNWTVEEQIRVVHNEPDFQVVDSYNVYLDPTGLDPNTCNMFRCFQKTIAEVKQCITSGYYKEIDVANLDKSTPESNINFRPESFSGVNSSLYKKTVDVWEFWGDLQLDGITFHDVLASFIGDQLVRFEPNPYWDGRPFVTFQFTPLINTPYGISAILPNMGILHELNVLANSRLDNIGLRINQMFEVVDGGLIEDDEVQSSPGKVFKVRERNTISPIDLGPPNFVVSVQESQSLASTVNANFGIGAVLGNSPMRSGERVTAQEIIALQDSGGNRLQNVFEGIETQYLLSVLRRMYAYMQQFIEEDEIVPTYTEKPGEVKYVWLGAAELQYDFRFKAEGARSAVRKKQFMDDVQMFLTTVSGIPEVRQKINWEKLLTEVLYKLSFENPETYLVEAPEPNDPADMTGQMGGQPPQDQGLAGALQQMGGDPMKHALQNQMQVDPQGLMSTLTGGQTMTPPPPPLSPTESL